MKLSDTFVVFDLDDTLYSERNYFLSGLHAVSRKLSAIFRQDVDTIIGSLVDSGVSDLWGGVCNRLGLPDSAKESLLWEYRLHTPEITLAPDASRFLSKVRGEAAGVAIVTDGRAVTQRLKLHALGLVDIPAYISEEYGASKPDPKRFELIEREYAADQFVYIGDNPKKDFVAPNRMGWTTLGLIDMGGNIHPQNLEDLAAEYHPDYWFESFCQLEEFFS